MITLLNWPEPVIDRNIYMNRDERDRLRAYMLVYTLIDMDTEAH